MGTRWYYLNCPTNKLTFTKLALPIRNLSTKDLFALLSFSQTPGYGTSWGTNFANGAGQYKSKSGFSKKALGLGVGAGFLGGAGLGVAGTLATYSVYHRYQVLDSSQGRLFHNFQEYRRLLGQRQGGHFWDSDYYSNYYSTNQVWKIKTTFGK